jgi:hypothetical protein
MNKPTWLSVAEETVWLKFWSNVAQNNYNSLDANESELIRSIYYRQLCETSVTYKRTGRYELPLKFQDGTSFLSNYGRMVIGNHGPYIEFAETDVMSHVEMKVVYETWRPKFDKAKYVWLTPSVDGISYKVKIYHQRWPVKYADYVKDRLYVSPYELRI